ncbi:MAG: pepsin/retropepsin-like aspartic protease family protein [Planctomycetota bacterium]
MECNKRKTLVNVVLVAISVFSIALTIFVRDLSRRQRNSSGKQTDYYVADSILDSLEPNQILGDDNPAFTVIDKEPNQFSIKWKKTEIYQTRTIRVNTLDSQCTRVMGSCWNGKGTLRPQYPVLIDTGNAWKVSVTDSIVKDARLGFYPKQMGDGLSGLCHLCQLRIGNITFIHPPCTSTSGHYEQRPVGEEAQVAHEILLGMGMLKSFKYVLFDTPSEQIEFSSHDSFDPNEPGLWRNYPMTIEVWRNNNDILFVTFPINGKDRKVKLDTGSTCGIVVTSSCWRDFFESMEHQGPKSTYIRKIDGFRRVDLYSVKELEFAGDVIGNAEVVVRPSDEEMAGTSEILVGMEFFQGRVLVLDFENGLLWLRKADMSDTGN